MSSNAFDRSWMVAAACRQYPAEWWFPTLPGKNGTKQAERAATICQTCPVISECSAYQKATHASWGVWAGHVLREQRRAS